MIGGIADFIDDGWAEYFDNFVGFFMFYQNDFYFIFVWSVLSMSPILSLGGLTSEITIYFNCLVL